jgi:dienelactone hydrolase
MSSTVSSIHRETISYSYNGTEYEGTLTWNAGTSGRKPGVLIAHAWMGLDAYAKRRAMQIARLGYAAFALDMYGGGKNAENTDEAGKLITALRSDRKEMRARAQAGLKVLREQRIVESRNLAAIGYCFGGCTVLELARDGADLRGVVSFHGLLDKGDAPTAKPMPARVLALHGHEDPLVPPEQVAAFQKEMTDAEADWQLVTFGGAVHAFTNSDAGSDKSTGLAYDPAADERSWQMMRAFLEKIFN